MPQYVLDASVSAKWYFEEDHSAQAAHLLADPRFDLAAPDFIYVEVAAVAWKRAIRNEIDRDKAESIVRELSAVPLETHLTSELVPAALTIALQIQRTVYDAVHLALAVQSHVPLLTADRKLFDAIKAGPLSAHIAWIGDVS